MSTSFVKPTPDAVNTLLAMLFGEELGVSASDAGDLAAQHIATFVDDEDKLVALCACDQHFVAYSGAALSMIPADVANEMITSNDISEALLGNFYEVMNICSKLMMSNGSAHLRLDQTLSAGQGADLVASLNGSAEILCFKIDIPRYGGGQLTFLVS